MKSTCLPLPLIRILFLPVEALSRRGDEAEVSPNQSHDKATADEATADEATADVATTDEAAMDM